MSEQSTVWVLVGTEAGAYLFISDHGGGWRRQGPWLRDEAINSLVLDERDPAAPETLFAATESGIWRSQDGGGSWRRLTNGLIYDRVWSVALADGHTPGTLLCGVEPAGLFASQDSGEQWKPIEGLNRHPSREEWWPGGAGLALHTILPNGAHPIVGISVAGVFASEDGGYTWEARNTGVPMPGDVPSPRFPSVHRCVHKIARDAADPHHLFQQNHMGIFESRDNGRHWEDIGAGLPSTFGFPLAAHPNEPGTIWVVPADGVRLRTEGQLTVWRRRDGAWTPLTAGLPAEVSLNVSRDGLATDHRSPCGLYLGTSDGDLWYSADEGARWECLAHGLPPIRSVKTAMWG